MSLPKLLDSYSIHQCSNDFQRLTKIAFNKAKANKSLILYSYLQLQDVICFSHYMSIVESKKNYNSQDNEDIEG